MTDLGTQASLPSGGFRQWWEQERRRPTGGSVAARIAQISRRRDVLRILVARDLKRKYATSYLGYAWTLLEPALTIAIYWLIWGHVARLAIQNYVVFIATAMVPWIWFRNCVNSSTGVLRGNAKLVSSISLPREIYPLELCLTKTVEFFFMLPIVAVLALSYGMHPTHYVVYLPLVFALELVLNIGLALLFSALTTLYTDVEHGLTVAMRLLFYLTPVLYPTSRLHGAIATIYQLNPLVGILEVHRAVWFGGSLAISPGHIAISVLGSVLCFVVGWSVFIKVEPAVLKEL